MGLGFGVGLSFWGGRGSRVSSGGWRISDSKW